MAKLTLNRKYQTFDAAHTMRRELYSFNKNRRELYLEDSPEPKVPKEEPEPTKLVAAASSGVEVVAVIPAPQPGSAASRPDVPVTAGEIIKVIVSHTLRKDITEASDASTIKGLAGGER